MPNMALCMETPLWESGRGGLVGRLGRTTRNPWADSIEEPWQGGPPITLSWCSESFEDERHLGGHEDSATLFCKLCRGGTLSKQILHSPPGRAGSNGREIHLRQLHSTVCFYFFIHSAKLLNFYDTAKHFVKKDGINQK